MKFSDGTDFNAEAVCANFDRWYNWTGVNQSENITYYYGKLFRGLQDRQDRRHLRQLRGRAARPRPRSSSTKPFAAFVQAMTLPAFSMQSPTALKEYNADDTQGTEDDPRFSAYATEHPTGTGPFVFEKWERDQQVTLKRNDSYWGDKAKVEKVIIRTISDPKARTQELQAGNIDGYDLVGPADVQPLKDAGFQIQNRPAFNILYLGINQKNKALQDVKVRQAIGHAIDKAAVVKSSLPEGSVPAKEFMPNLVEGYNDSIEDPAYDVEEAKKLLKEAGAGEPGAQVRLPDGCLPALHAVPGGHLRGDQVPAGEGRHQGHPGRGQVEPGLPGHDPGRRGDGQARHPPARLDR